MPESISHSARAILRTVAELQNLKEVLRTDVSPKSPTESLRMRNVVQTIDSLIMNLRGIGDKVTSESGVSLDQAQQQLDDESRNRRVGQLTATDRCEEPVKKAADLEGVMVALMPGKTLAQRIATDGGEAWDRLHVTLLYFKDKFEDRDDWEKLISVVEKLAEKHPKLSGHISGAGRFVGEESDVAWNSIDLPGLAEFRNELLEAAEKAGFEVSKTHDFVPHMTVAYIKPGDPYPRVLVDKTPIRFSSVAIVAGDKKLANTRFGQKM